MSAAQPVAPSDNTVAGLNIVAGAPLQDDDLLVFKAALNGWVFEPASAVGVTLANLSINVDKDWLNRNITNLGDLSFNRGVFLSATFQSALFVTLRLSPAANFPGADFQMFYSDENINTISRGVFYGEGRVDDSINQTSTVASNFPLYKMQAEIDPSNDVGGFPSILQYRLEHTTSAAIVNRSLFQVLNAANTALELKTDRLEVLGNRVFTQNTSFENIMLNTITIANNATSTITELRVTLPDLSSTNGRVMIQYLIFTIGTGTAQREFEIKVTDDGGNVDITKAATPGVDAGSVTVSYVTEAKGQVVDLVIFNDNSGGSINVLGDDQSQGVSRVQSFGIG